MDKRHFYGLKVEATFTPDVIQIDTYSVANDIRSHLLTETLSLKEKAVREALIKLGWTPPKDGHVPTHD